MDPERYDKELEAKDKAEGIRVHLFWWGVAIFIFVVICWVLR